MRQSVGVIVGVWCCVELLRRIHTVHVPPGLGPGTCQLAFGEVGLVGEGDGRGEAEEEVNHVLKCA